MNGCGKRRRIRKVRIFKVFQLCPHIDTHYGNVHHFIHRTRSQYLHAQQAVAFFLCNEFCGKKRRIGIIVGLIVRHRKHSLHLIPRRFGLDLGQTGTSTVQAGQFYNPCAQHTGIRFLHARQNLCQCPPFQIGGRTHGRPLGRTGHPAFHQRTVSCRIYIRKVGAHHLIYHNGSPVHLQTASFQKRCIGPDACRHNQQRAGKGPRRSTHCRNALLAQHLLCLCPGNHPDAFLQQMLFPKSGHLRIQNPRQNLRCKINDRNTDASLLKVFRHLQADKARAYHHGLFHAFFLRKSPHRNSVFRLPHSKYACKFHTFHRWKRGGCPYSDDQLIIRQYFFFPGRHIFYCHRLRSCIQSNGFFSCLHFHPC